MRPDGGEARKITEAKDGVGAFAFSRDGKMARVFRRQGRRAAGLDLAGRRDRNRQTAAVDQTRDAGRFVAILARQQTNLFHLAGEFEQREQRARRDRSSRSASATRSRRSTICGRSSWITKQEIAPDFGAGLQRQRRDDLERFEMARFPRHAERPLPAHGHGGGDLRRPLPARSRHGQDRTSDDNKEIGESALSFSPDSSMIAFSAADDFTYFRNNRVYVRPVRRRGGQWKKLGGDFDGDVSAGFWSEDGKTIYFNEGWRATNQLFSVSTETGKVTQLTNEKARSLGHTGRRHEETDHQLLRSGDAPELVHGAAQSRSATARRGNRSPTQTRRSGTSRWARPKRSNGNRRTARWSTAFSSNRWITSAASAIR